MNFPLCQYGCGQRGRYVLPYVKKWCCSKSINSCPEMRRRNSEGLKGDNNPAKRPESRKKISEKKKGIPKTEKHKKSISETVKRLHQDCSYRKRFLKGRKGHKQKLKDLWKNPNSAYNSEKYKNYSAEKARNTLTFRNPLPGAKNPMWRGGIAFLPYPYNWHSQIRKPIMKRDNYECQNPECQGKSDRIMVHHIDYDKENCSPANLITLCNSCHSKTNAHREYWEKELIRIRPRMD